MNTLLRTVGTLFGEVDDGPGEYDEWLQNVLTFSVDLLHNWMLNRAHARSGKVGVDVVYVDARGGCWEAFKAVIPPADLPEDALPYQGNLGVFGGRGAQTQDDVMTLTDLILHQGQDAFYAATKRRMAEHPTPEERGRAQRTFEVFRPLAEAHFGALSGRQAVMRPLLLQTAQEDPAFEFGFQLAHPTTLATYALVAITAGGPIFMPIRPPSGVFDLFLEATLEGLRNDIQALAERAYTQTLS